MQNGLRVAGDGRAHDSLRPAVDNHDDGFGMQLVRQSWPRSLAVGALQSLEFARAAGRAKFFDEEMRLPAASGADHLERFGECRGGIGSLTGEVEVPHWTGPACLPALPWRGSGLAVGRLVEPAAACAGEGHTQAVTAE